MTGQIAVWLLGKSGRHRIVTDNAGGVGFNRGSQLIRGGLMARGQLQMHLALLRRQLDAALQRLGDADDIEALHELRVILRRLRMLLRPLDRSGPAEAQLAAATALFCNTNALRDDEVLLVELLAHGEVLAAQGRRDAQRALRRDLVASTGLADLLAAWPQAGVVPLVAACSRRRHRHRLKRQMRTGTRKARRAVCHLLRQANPDLHAVRLAVKRLRYRLLARKRTPPHLLVLLELAQEVLGEWHDRDVWLLRAEKEADLAGCTERWRHEKHILEARWQPLREGLGLVLTA